MEMNISLLMGSKLSSMKNIKSKAPLNHMSQIDILILINIMIFIKALIYEIY